MKRILILFVLILITGCTFKFSPDELRQIEFYHPTTDTDWRDEVYEKKDTITNISTNLSIAITELINNNSITIGVYKRMETNESECRLKPNEDPGMVVLTYRTGDITLENDPCNNESINSIMYDKIKLLIRDKR